MAIKKVKIKDKQNNTYYPRTTADMVEETDTKKFVSPSEKTSWNIDKVYSYNSLPVETVNNPAFLENYELSLSTENTNLIGLPSGWYHLKFFRHYHGNGFGTQIAFPYGVNKIYIRSSNGTAWTQWVEINDSKLDTAGGTIIGDLNVKGKYLAGGIPFEDIYLKRYGLNQINIDTTPGNWSCNIVSTELGTVPYGVLAWFNVIQFESNHFFTQIATYSSGNIGAFIRTKYVSNPTWGEWGRIVTEPIATPEKTSIEATLLDTQYRLTLLENGVQDLK